MGARTTWRLVTTNVFGKTNRKLCQHTTVKLRPVIGQFNMCKLGAITT